MYTYLNQRYGLKNLIIEWASSIINGIKMLHLYGTYDQGEEEEGEVYEVLNIRLIILKVL